MGRSLEGNRADHLSSRSRTRCDSRLCSRLCAVQARHRDEGGGRFIACPARFQVKGICRTRVRLTLKRFRLLPDRVGALPQQADKLAGLSWLGLIGRSCPND